MLHSSYNFELKFECTVASPGYNTYSRVNRGISSYVALVNNQVNNIQKTAFKASQMPITYFVNKISCVAIIAFYCIIEYLQHLKRLKHSYYYVFINRQSSEHIQSNEQNGLFTAKKKARSPPGLTLFNSNFYQLWNEVKSRIQKYEIFYSLLIIVKL